ncbi:MAG TPA: hypothetical protein VJX23_10540 [Candidatus Binataceae bacterium]|nr:hypothetical protein [Candidatus Binataceae bacterium]
MEGRRLTRISRTVAADPRPAACFFSFRFSYFSVDSLVSRHPLAGSLKRELELIQGDAHRGRAAARMRISLSPFSHQPEEIHIAALKFGSHYTGLVCGSAFLRKTRAR